MKKVMLVLVLVCCFIISSVEATIYFDDGEIYNIASFSMSERNGHINNNFWGEPTTVNIISGANTDYNFWVYETSLLNIYGQIDYARAFGNSQITITWGGEINALRAYDNSQVIISGGDVGYFSFIEDYSQVYISGGRIAGDLTIKDHSMVDIFGGSIGGQITLYDWSTVTFHGSNFTLDGRAVYGTINPLYVSGRTYGTLTGTLVDGTVFNHHLQFGGLSNISLILVPEPAMILLLSMGMLFVMRKRQKE